MLATAITPMQPRQHNSELFLGQYFGTQYSGFKTPVGLVVHALRSIWEQGCRARLSAKSHANIICPARCPVVAIFTLRGIGKSITVAAEEVSPS
jgi:hypothetical protein